MWPWQKKRPAGPSYIGPGVCITGRIESAGELTIEGRVEGDIVHEGRLVIGAGAEIVSNIRATSVQVAGQVEGNVQVEETLELLATARLHGDIACVALQVAQGAVFSGRNHMAGAQVVPVPAAAPRQMAEPVAAPLAILLEPVGIEEREVLGVAERVPPVAAVQAAVAPEAPAAPVTPAAPAAPKAPAPGARAEAPAFYGGFSQAVRSEAS